MTHLLAEGGYQIFTLHSSEKTLAVLRARLCAWLPSWWPSFWFGACWPPTRARPTMKDIAKAIQEGAEAFLARQFKTIGVIIIPLAVLIFFTATKVTHTGPSCSPGRDAPASPTRSPT